MITAEIDPRDLLSLDLAFTRLEGKVLLHGEWEPFIARVEEVVSVYPPDFPGNTYVRTGHLGRNWHRGVLDPWTAQVGNAAIYAGYVHGHEQIALHAGHGWKHLFDEGSRLLDIFAQKIWEKAMLIWTQ